MRRVRDMPCGINRVSWRTCLVQCACCYDLRLPDYHSSSGMPRSLQRQVSQHHGQLFKAPDSCSLPRCEDPWQASKSLVRASAHETDAVVLVICGNRVAHWLFRDAQPLCHAWPRRDPVCLWKTPDTPATELTRCRTHRAASQQGLLQVGLALYREEQCRQCRSQPAMPPLIWQGQSSGREKKKEMSPPCVRLAGAMPRQPPTPDLPPVDKEASTQSGPWLFGFIKMSPKVTNKNAPCFRGHGSAD